jgi:hypothetical protein
MNCPLCGQRKTRRACPALGRDICAVCCGTKRLTEIQCPADCAYLALAREHPPAAAVRQHQRDVTLVVQFIRDFNQRQSQLFLLVSSFLARYPSPELQPIIDDDVAEAAGAIAATFETASRGVIYDHRPASLVAERLAAALKSVLIEAGKDGGSAFERDAAAVLRRIQDAVGDVRTHEPENRRALLDMLARIVQKEREGGAGGSGDSQEERPRLIVP